MARSPFFNADDVTPRVRYGLVILAALFVALGVSRWSDRLDDRRSEVETLEYRLAELNALRGTDIWTDRLAISETMTDMARARMWTGDSPGVIAAEIDQQIRAVAMLYEVENIRISVDPSTTDVGDLQIMSFQFAGNARPQTTPLPLIMRLAGTEKAIFVEDVRFNIDRRGISTSNFSFSGYAPVSITDPEVANENG